MSTIQELAPYIAGYPEKIRQAKALKGLTINDLVDQTGIAPSAISRLLDGTQSEPKLYNSAALCRALDLSMDELFGLHAAEPDTAELHDRLHTLELENVRLASECEQLHAEASHQKEKAELWRGRFIARQPLFIIITATVFVLVAMLAVYMMFDASILNAGLIQNGELSAYAWLLIAIIAAAVIVSAFALIKSLLRSHRKD